MNPNLYEPNDFEKARDYLDDFKESYKETHFISSDNEAKLFKLLEDYFWIRANGSPVIASEKWSEVAKILETCELKDN